jgi:hypothetical protein
MAKIENDAKTIRPHRYEVLISFDSLNKGETFTASDADTSWEDRHVATGYLRDLSEEAPDGQRSEDGQG